MTGEVNRAARGCVSLGLRPGAASWQALSPPSPSVKGHRGLLFEDGYGRRVLAQPGLRTRTGILGCLRRESDLSPGALPSAKTPVYSNSTYNLSKPLARLGHLPCWGQFFGIGRLFLVPFLPCSLCHNFCRLSRETFLKKNFQFPISCFSKPVRLAVSFHSDSSSQSPP